MSRSNISISRITAATRSTISRSLQYSMSLNGTTDYAFTSDKPSLYSTLNQVYSLEFWVNGAAQGTRIFAWNRTSGNAIIAIGGGGAGNAKLSLFYRNDSNGILLNNVVSTTSVLDSTWHHVVISDNAGTMKVYIDKVLDATSFTYTVSGTFTSLNTTAVGCLLAGSASGFFSGKIDQVRLYNIAVSQAQVNAAFANSGYPAANLIYDLQFNEGSGTTIGNRGQFGSSWSLVGGTYSTSVPTIAEPISRSLA